VLQPRGNKTVLRQSEEMTGIPIEILLRLAGWRSFHKKGQSLQKDNVGPRQS